MKCNDCRKPTGVQKVSTRSDVCDACWQRRLDTIRGFSKGGVSIQEMHSIQGAMLGESELPASVLMDTAQGKHQGDFSI